MKNTADIALIGLAVMGENLARNLGRNGFAVAVYNRTPARTAAFLERFGAEGAFSAPPTLRELCASLTVPRKVFLMVKAGPAVDQLIAELKSYLETGDIIIDGGNSYFQDSCPRTAELAADGINFVGVGISGGEKGALEGPSIMPGGPAAVWPQLRKLLQSIAARLPDGTPCCDYIGPDGAGHYVKMVHNGIEYADMQLLAECYDLLKNTLKLPQPEIAAVFEEWRHTELAGYLMDITSGILAAVDPVSGRPVLELIADRANANGTGRWTTEEAIRLGSAVPGIAEALFARQLSRSPLRPAAQETFGAADRMAAGEAAAFIADLRAALYASRLAVYAQGFALLQRAATEYGWQLDLARIARLWKAGCIIRAAFLDDIAAAYRRNPALPFLPSDEFFAGALQERLDSWRRAVCAGILSGVPLPTMSATLGWFDTLRSAPLPAGLIQAQRDWFGAHRFERVDRGAGEMFHYEWEK